MRPWLARAEVCVCPITEGGGTRLKILDAMAMGKPVVSTTIGCEGLRVRPGENIVVADTPGEFAAGLVQLFESEDLRRRIGASGRALVEREYCWERIAEHLQEACRVLWGNRGAQKQKTADAETDCRLFEVRPSP